MLLTIFCIWFIGVFSIVYALVKLCRPGFSQETRSLVVKRHMLTIITYLICDLYTQVSIFKIFKLSEEYHTQYLDYWYVFVLKIIYINQGVPSCLIRLSEPYFYQIMLNKFKQNYRKCCMSREQRNRIREMTS